MYSLIFAGVMLTPVAMAAVGLAWRIHPPKNRNQMLSYRTVLSMKNEDTWQFAHHQVGKLWVRLGVLLAIVSAVLMVWFKDSFMSFALWLVVGQMVLLCVSVFLVDTLMKAVFDEDGNRV